MSAPGHDFQYRRRSSTHKTCTRCDLSDLYAIGNNVRCLRPEPPPPVGGISSIAGMYVSDRYDEQHLAFHVEGTLQQEQQSHDAEIYRIAQKLGLKTPATIEDILKRIDVLTAALREIVRINTDGRIHTRTRQSLSVQTAEAAARASQ